MVDKDSHSTDLTVSVEEGYWTILLAHYIFLVLIEDKVIQHAGYAAKLHKNA